MSVPDFPSSTSAYFNKAEEGAEEPAFFEQPKIVSVAVTAITAEKTLINFFSKMPPNYLLII